MNRYGWFAATVVLLGVGMVAAEKELMYDPVQGIIFVDKKDGGQVQGQSRETVNARQPKPAVLRKKAATDIHVGRKKDPPELYFKSGLEYFKNADFNNALKNFRYADSLEHRPEYMLFIGKTLRNLNHKGEMIKVMFDILKDEPDSDVADDALLELAMFYKLDGDYDKSINLFTRLIEQYPFGLEYSTGEELPVLAREQRRLMRAELINMLTTLGFTGDDLQTTLTAFQKSRGLPQSGLAGRETVMALRAAHREYLRLEEEKTMKQQQMDQFRGWIYGAVTAGGLNILLLGILLTKAYAHKRQVMELLQIISELEVKKT